MCSSTFKSTPGTQEKPDKANRDPARPGVFVDQLPHPRTCANQVGDSRHAGGDLRRSECTMRFVPSARTAGSPEVRPIGRAPAIPAAKTNESTTQTLMRQRPLSGRLGILRLVSARIVWLAAATALSAFVAACAPSAASPSASSSPTAPPRTVSPATSSAASVCLAAPTPWSAFVAACAPSAASPSASLSPTAPPRTVSPATSSAASTPSVTAHPSLGSPSPADRLFDDRFGLVVFDPGGGGRGGLVTPRAAGGR